MSVPLVPHLVQKKNFLPEGKDESSCIKPNKPCKVAGILVQVTSLSSG